MDLEAGVGTGPGRKYHHEPKIVIAMLIKVPKNTGYAMLESMRSLNESLNFKMSESHAGFPC